MKCPSCNNPKTSILDTRDASKGRRRRRECPDCGKFTTYEIYASEMHDMEVLKKLLASIGALAAK